ncbi:MAG: hypothetical protein QM661_08675 [Solimonas sp.]
MSNIELRPQRRVYKKERDNWPHVLTITVIVLFIGFMTLKNYARKEKIRQDQNEIENNSLAAQEAKKRALDAEIRRRIRADIDGGRNQYAPGSPPPTVVTESGKKYYVQSSAPRAENSNELTAEEHYRRAIQIMENGSQNKNIRSYSSSGNDVLRIADGACKAVLAKGTIEYRKCRANQWRRLRDGCIHRHEQLKMATGEHYQALKATAEEWCSAENQYKIID